MRDAADLPALLQSFFTTRLMMQRKVSTHTIASYRDTFRLLLQFAQKRLHKPPLNSGWTIWMPLWSGHSWKIWKKPPQWRQKPELAFDGDPVVLPLRLAGSSRAQRNHPTSAGDSEPTAATHPGGLSDPARDRGAAGRAESNDVAGTPGSCLSDHRRSDRSAIVRDDRVTARGCLAWSRRTCALLWKRPKGTLYSPGQTHGRGPQSVASGARQGRLQNAVSQRSW